MIQYYQTKQRRQKVPVEKNKEYIVNIIDNGFEGEGIAKIEGFTIFIPNAIKGEKVKIIIVKVLTSHAFGKIIQILEPSPNRVEADCNTYKRCGGCSLRHIDYKETLKMKQNAVQSLVNKTLQNKIQVKETVGMDNPYHYRNKVQFPVGIDKNGVPQLGVFANRTHEIIPIQKCMIQNEKAEQIAKSVFKFWVDEHISIYQENTQKGLLRHIVVKTGIKTNEYMCIVVINGKNIINEHGTLIQGASLEEKLIDNLKNEFPELKTIVINSNMKNTNVILGKENRVIYGDGYITDKLGEYYFKISPFSFYQVNPVQAEKLYTIGVQAANISKEDVVFDLYCGIGTISLFMAKYAKKVYGIEIVEEAVKMAKENAVNNHVDNVEFLAGDVEKILDELINEKNILPDVVMVDPPRRGLDKHSVENILKIRPKRMVYISCNPATLVRDLHLIEGEYLVEEIRPVDMFPFTRTYRNCYSYNTEKSRLVAI